MNTTTVRDVLMAIVLFSLIMSVAAGLTFLLTSAVGGKESPIDTRFRAACTQVNGVAVWNGKHWECLK